METRYLAPFDMLNGRIKKNDIFIKSTKSKGYHVGGVLNWLIPSEIVEKWKIYKIETLDEFSKFKTEIKSVDELFLIICKHNILSYNLYLNLPGGSDEGKAYNIWNTWYSVNPPNPHQALIDDWLKSGKTKIVQFYNPGLNIWSNSVGQPYWDKNLKYRFKPEPKYVPFTFDDAKDLIGKAVKDKRNQSILLIIRIDNVETNLLYSIYFANDYSINYNSLLSNFTFLDGSSCGKLSE